MDVIEEALIISQFGGTDQKYVPPSHATVNIVHPRYSNQEAGFLFLSLVG